MFNLFSTQRMGHCCRLEGRHHGPLPLTAKTLAPPLLTDHNVRHMSSVEYKDGDEKFIYMCVN